MRGSRATESGCLFAPWPNQIDVAEIGNACAKPSVLTGIAPTSSSRMSFAISLTGASGALAQPAVPGQERFPSLALMHVNASGQKSISHSRLVLQIKPGVS